MKDLYCNTQNAVLNVSLSKYLYPDPYYASCSVLKKIISFYMNKRERERDREGEREKKIEREREKIQKG